MNRQEAERWVADCQQAADLWSVESQLAKVEGRVDHASWCQDQRLANLHAVAEFRAELEGGELG